uniref:Adhesion G protein-coupled receptor E1 n=1 Tax=Microcebus murinus TaxID=30608 RepID=A0A8C5W786_MICMU
KFYFMIFPCLYSYSPISGPLTLLCSLPDIDECHTSGVCPEHSHCANSVGSYSCNCQAGFISIKSTCEDVDECSQSPPACGPHSVCENMPGTYRCSCLSGFSSPTGNGWIPGNPGNFGCTDIDECHTSGICPEHSHCANSVGSYSCICQVGFISSESTCEEVDECANPGACPEHATCSNTLGNYSCVCNPGFEPSGGPLTFLGVGGSCEDIDECAASRCPANAACANTPGSYFCTCHPGFAPSSGQPSFADQRVTCTDADECSQDPSPCGPHSVCTNVPGSYSCSCAGGFRPDPEGSWKHGNFSCKRVPFRCKEDVLSNNKQAQQCQGGAALKPEYVSFCALINATLLVLDDVCGNETTAVYLEVKINTANSLAAVLERTSALSEVSKEKTSALGTAILESVESAMLARLPSASITPQLHLGSSDIESRVMGEECTGQSTAFRLRAKGDEMKVGCSTIKESASPGTVGVAFVSFAGLESVLDERFSQDLQSPLANPRTRLKINSRVIGGVMTGEKKENFLEPVVYTLENTQPKQESESPICVSWSAAGGRWTASGCAVQEASATHTVCSCRHMANLAVLMASGELTMSCTIIAGALHYLFLACFFWMLVEAVMLFLMVRNLKVVNYFSSRNVKTLYLCAFSYGLPALVVVVSASVHPRGYGMHDRCWLDTKRGFIWSFLGPVCTIITVNSVLLTWTLCILRQKLSSVNAEVSTLKDTRLLTFKAFAQLFVLGCTWVLGVFQIGPLAGVMAYLFTIINSLQGAFIFLIHCLLSRQVREEYRRWITRKAKPSSQSQSSGILLSSVPTSSKTVRDRVRPAGAGVLAAQRPSVLPGVECPRGAGCAHLSRFMQ